MGLCHEFGSQINAGCDHPMRAGASACSCPDCGVVCQGLFDGCVDVWARGPRPVTIAATRASAGDTAVQPAARVVAAPIRIPDTGHIPDGRPTQPVQLAPPPAPAPNSRPNSAPGPRRTNGIRGGNRARAQAAESYSKSDLPPPQPESEGDPRQEMFRWFEEAFDGVRTDLQMLIASTTHQQAMLAELIDSRQAELRLVLAAEALPDIVADAVANAMEAHTAAMTESFSVALGTFREELDKSQAATGATVDNLRDSFDTFLNALAEHDAGAAKREGARLGTLKGSITKQMAPLAEAVELLTAQAAAADSARSSRRQPTAAPAPAPTRAAAAAGAAPSPAAPAGRAPRVVTGGQATPARPPRVVTGPQVRPAAPARPPRVVTGPQVKPAAARAAAARPTAARRPTPPTASIPSAVADKSPLLRTIRSSRAKP